MSLLGPPDRRASDVMTPTAKALEASSLSITDISMASFKPIQFGPSVTLNPERASSPSTTMPTANSKHSALKGLGISLMSMDTANKLLKSNHASSTTSYGKSPVATQFVVQPSKKLSPRDRPVSTLLHKKKVVRKKSLLSFESANSTTLLETIHNAIDKSISVTRPQALPQSAELATFGSMRRSSKSMMLDMSSWNTNLAAVSRRMTLAAKDVLSITFREDQSGALSNLAMKKLDDALHREHALHVIEERDKAVAQWKELADNRRRLEQAAMWATAMKAFGYVLSLRTTFLKRKHECEIQRQFYPYLLRMLRRFARRIRLKLNAPQIRPPLLSQVRMDKTLSLFNDAHLMHFISTLRLRYYFPGEVIVYKDVVEDEAFVLAQGKANVLVKGVVVFTMNPGACIGTAGMVSGEPRSATVVSLDGCYVFVSSRKDFEAFGDVTSEAAAAHALLDDMRRRNLKHVYQPLLNPQALQHFSTFHDVEESALQQLVASGTSDAVSAGTVLYSAVRPACKKDVYAMLILRGTIRILKNVKIQHPAGKCNRELCMQIVDCGTHAELVFRNPADTAEPGHVPPPTAHRPSFIANSKAVIDNEEHVVLAECSAPCLLRFSESLSCDWYYVAVQAAHPCDLIRFPHDLIISLDIVAIHQLRENCNRRQIANVIPPPRQALLSILFPGSLSFDFLRLVKLQRLHLEPYIASPGEDLIFTGEFGYILESGTLSGKGDYVTDGGGDREQKYPFVWPAVSVVYFGCENVHARVKARAEVLRFSRRELIVLLRGSLSPQRLETLTMALACDFSVTFRKQPVFIPVETGDDGEEDEAHKKGPLVVDHQPEAVELAPKRPVHSVPRTAESRRRFPASLAHLHKNQLAPQAQGALLQQQLMSSLHPPLLQHPIRRLQVSKLDDAADCEDHDSSLQQRKPPLPLEARPAPRDTSAPHSDDQQGDSVPLGPNQQLFFDNYKRHAAEAARKDQSRSGQLQLTSAMDGDMNEVCLFPTRPPSSSSSSHAGPCGGRRGLEKALILPSSIPRSAPLSIPSCNVESLAVIAGKRVGVTQQDVDKLIGLEMMLRNACMS